MSRLTAAVAGLLLLIVAADAQAACVNRFVRRSEGPRQVITLLTGKLTFQEAQQLAEAINDKKAPPLQWVDDAGKLIATQVGELKVVRPMPVGCDGKSSGVVMIATFGSVNQPARRMNVKLDAASVVRFDEQTN